MKGTAPKRLMAHTMHSAVLVFLPISLDSSDPVKVPRIPATTEMLPNIKLALVGKKQTNETQNFGMIRAKN